MIKESFPLLVGGDKIFNEKALLTIESGELMDSADSVKYIIIHCSATRCNQDYTEKQLLRDHKARGFNTVGYHFYIRRNGKCTQFRRLLEVGAHCRPYNRCSIGICYEGGLDSQGNPADTRTVEQAYRLKELINILKHTFPNAVVRGHRDMPGATPKECPCFEVGSEY